MEEGEGLFLAAQWEQTLRGPDSRKSQSSAVHGDAILRGSFNPQVLPTSGNEVVGMESGLYKDPVW